MKTKWVCDPQVQAIAWLKHYYNMQYAHQYLMCLEAQQDVPIAELWIGAIAQELI